MACSGKGITMSSTNLPKFRSTAVRTMSRSATASFCSSVAIARGVNSRETILRSSANSVAGMPLSRTSGSVKSYPLGKNGQLWGSSLVVVMSMHSCVT